MQNGFSLPLMILVPGLLLGLAVPAGAETVHTLSYDGPQGCANRSEFVAAIESRGGHLAADDAKTLIRFQILWINGPHQKTIFTNARCVSCSTTFSTACRSHLVSSRIVWALQSAQLDSLRCTRGTRLLVWCGTGRSRRLKQRHLTLEIERHAAFIQKVSFDLRDLIRP